ncbi:GntR family transcriptional regulator [Oscillospiraceae bacterium PP1C4]
MDNTSAFTSNTIYHMLKDEILNLNIKPGQQISESEICERFHVSRTPVRTAFQRLKDAGLLHIIPYKSTSATLLDFDQINQLIYMRIAIETMVIRDLIQTIDSLTIEKIRYILKHQEILLAGTFEADEFYAIDSKLHNIWFDYTKKLLLWKAIQKAQVNYTRFRMLDIVEAQNFQEIYLEHIELFDAIVRKDIEIIEPLMRKHLYGGIKRLGNRIHTEFADYFVKKEEPMF